MPVRQHAAAINKKLLPNKIIIFFCRTRIFYKFAHKLLTCEQNQSKYCFMRRMKLLIILSLLICLSTNVYAQVLNSGRLILLIVSCARHNQI